MRKTGLLLFTVVLLSGITGAEYVGVAPGVKDAGVVEPGEAQKVNFYIVTDINELFTVSPGFQRPGASMFRQKPRTYNFDPDKASQEDISSWIEFDQDSFTVDPSTEEVISLQDGGVANTKGKISFILDVPKDAESGYHAGAINLNPNLNPSGGAGGGAAVQTLGVSQPVFVFRVPGPAKRSVEVLQVNAIRTGSDNARVDYVLKNNGTVTVRLNRAETFLYNQFGNKTGKITTGGKYLEPEESRVIQSPWSNNDLQTGSYRVRGEMGYMTGKAFIDETVSISELPVSVEGTDETGEKDPVIPSWIVAMLLIMAGILMFYLGVDPVWISIATGIGAISALILYLGLPAELIGGILILAVLALIYWW